MLGVHLGSEKNLLGPSSSNPKGYWEHQQFIKLNDEILKRLGGSWYAMPRFPRGWEKSSEFEDLQREAARSIAGDFSSADLWGWKDPRTCLTLPFWQRVLPNMKYVIGIRNPEDVVSSLQRRDGFSREQAQHLWLVYLRAALKHTFGRPRIVVSYEDLLDNWRDQLPRISQFIGKSEELKNPDVQKAVRESIDKNLRHHSSDVEKEQGDGNSNKPFELARGIYKSLKHGDFRLSHILEEGIASLEHEVNRQTGEPEYRWLYGFQQTLQELDNVIPAQDQFALISWYQWGADQLIAGRNAVPFIGRNGQYLGPPADDETAIQELEKMRTSGVKFIVFGSPAFWWLEYYSAFNRHLRSNFKCLLENDRLVIFDLRTTGLL